jgi:acetylornithine deacetylase/succinyl-diaminopimelate desuccinylase-like protein
MNPSPSSRDGAIARAWQQFDSGRFTEVLARRVAIASCSQEASAAPALRAYLADELLPSLQALGFEGRLFDNPAAPAPGAGPFLVAHRHEAPGLPTVLSYAHGDVIRGQDASWTQGAGPWTLVHDGERLYGRGTADNKGQHSINLAALEAVLQARGGRLGFNLTLLVETGEETGSPGLAAFCTAHRERLKADVFIASDGPRVARDRPTLFMGSRGVANFTLTLHCRDGAHHSGNWGGLLRNPGTVMASAIASLVDGRGVIRVPALRPPPIPATVREALAGLRFGGDAGDPAVDADWGEPGLTPAERREHARGAGLRDRQPARTRQRHPAAGGGAPAPALRRRHRSRHAAQSGAAAPRGSRLWRHRGVGARSDGRDAARPARPLGRLRRRFGAAQHRPAAGAPAQPGRQPAQRGVR